MSWPTTIFTAATSPSGSARERRSFSSLIPCTSVKTPAYGPVIASCNLLNLQEFRAASNRLSGTIPPELATLSSLRQLNLSGNELTGCIPPGLRRADENDFDKLGLPFCQVKMTAEREGDQVALVALYNATDGANWKRNKNWLSDLPIGE